MKLLPRIHHYAGRVFYFFPNLKFLSGGVESRHTVTTKDQSDGTNPDGAIRLKSEGPGSGSSAPPAQKFYITRRGCPVIESFGKDRLYALGNAGFTVWTETEWSELESMRELQGKL